MKPSLTKKPGIQIFLLCIIAGAALGMSNYVDHHFSASIADQSAQMESVRTGNEKQTTTLEEAGSMDASAHSTWWVNSGAYAFLSNATTISTVQGRLPLWSLWRMKYLLSNAEDTDQGFHPQNIFRLIAQARRTMVEQSMYVIIHTINESDSPNRNESNGVLFMSRYQDGNNLYYAGIRVDGFAVIKKKISGVYSTMAYEPLFASSSEAYTNLGKRNFLPLERPIGIKNIVYNPTPTTVRIELYVDTENTGNWKLAASAEDSAEKYAGPPFLTAGYTGIRTDFMDVTMTNYTIRGS